MSGSVPVRGAAELARWAVEQAMVGWASSGHNKSLEKITGEVIEAYMGLVRQILAEAEVPREPH